MVVARVTSKGQITIPRVVRRHLRIEPGDSIDFRIVGDQVEVRPLRQRRVREFRGLFRPTQPLDFNEERARAWEARSQSIAGARRADG